MPRKSWHAPGPYPWFLWIFIAAMVAIYVPAKKTLVPLVQEIWYQKVTRSLVISKKTLQLDQGLMLLGATRPELPQSLYGMESLQNRLDHRLTLLSIYQAWGHGQDHEFPLEAARNIDKAGYTVLITWEPWISAFAQITQEGDSTLYKISQGHFDEYIHRWARSVVQFAKPILIRPAHEMSNPQYAWSSHYGNSPEIFIAFWKHVIQIFRQEGAINAQFVWSPYSLQDHAFYPGEEWVDAIGLDIFNYGGLSLQGTWLDFYTLCKLQVDAYKVFNKPIILAEVATSNSGGNKEDWLRDMFRTLKNKDLPEVRGLILFDIPAGTTASGLPVDWSIDEFSEVQRMFHTDSILSIFKPNPRSIPKDNYEE